MASTNHVTEHPLLAGLGGRCPRCAKASVFDGFLEVAKSCPACQLGLEDHDAGDAPAVAATFILGTVVVGLAAVLEFTFHPPLWVHAALWGPAVIGGSVGILRPLKGLTIALQYKNRAVDEPTEPGGS